MAREAPDVEGDLARLEELPRQREDWRALDERCGARRAAHRRVSGQSHERAASAALRPPLDPIYHEMRLLQGKRRKPDA
jgi:hypothetical protein